MAIASTASAGVGTEGSRPAAAAVSYFATAHLATAPIPYHLERLIRSGLSPAALERATARAAIAHLEADLREHAAMSARDRASYRRQLGEWRAHLAGLLAAGEPTDD